MSEIGCTDIVLNLFKVNHIFQMVYLSIACGAISLVISKSALLNGFHAWLEKRSPFLEEMLSCPWCTSHWVALILILAYQPMLLTIYNHPVWQVTNWFMVFILTPIDLLVNVMVMVFLASIAARIIYSAYKPIME